MILPGYPARHAGPGGPACWPTPAPRHGRTAGPAAEYGAASHMACAAGRDVRDCHGVVIGPAALSARCRFPVLPVAAGRPGGERPCL